MRSSGADVIIADKFLIRITMDPGIMGGNPIIPGRRLVVEQVVGMRAARNDVEEILERYPWFERENFFACLIFAHRLVRHERVDPGLA